MLGAYAQVYGRYNVLNALKLISVYCICRNGSSSSVASEESDAEHSAASEESDEAAGDTDADDFQQATRPRSKKSAYDVDIPDSEQESESDSPGAGRRGSRRSSRGKTANTNTALPARRQPRRTAAAKVNCAESPSSDSSEADSQQSAEEEDEEEASDDNQEASRSKKRTGRQRRADKAGAKRQRALMAEDGSDDSMAEAEHDTALIISDSEAQADEESDKENQPTKQTRFCIALVTASCKVSRTMHQVCHVLNSLHPLHVCVHVYCPEDQRRANRQNSVYASSLRSILGAFIFCHVQ